MAMQGFLWIAPRFTYSSHRCIRLANILSGRILFFNEYKPMQGLQCSVLRYTYSSSRFIRLANTLSGKFFMAFEDKFLQNYVMKKVKR